MDFRDSPDEAAFRREVREFISAEYKKDGDGGTVSAPQAASAGGPDALKRYNAWIKKLSAKAVGAVNPVRPVDAAEPAGPIGPAAIQCREESVAVYVLA